MTDNPLLGAALTVKMSNDGLMTEVANQKLRITKNIELEFWIYLISSSYVSWEFNLM